MNTELIEFSELKLGEVQKRHHLLAYLRLAHQWSLEPERSQQLPRLLAALVRALENIK